MTLADLATLVDQYRKRDIIIVSHDEWLQLRRYIGLEFVVSATATRPPFFWFADKKIVTPAYVLAKEEALHES